MKKIVLVILVCAVGIHFSSCSKKTVELDFNSQLTKDVAAIDAYLASHNITAVKDTSGVRWVIKILGTGVKPTLAGNVTVKYTASLLANSSVFDQSKGSVFPLNGLINGWRVALPQIPKGSSFTLYIPSGLAYGHAGVTNSVPGDANFVFDIELLDDDVQLIADVAAIAHYLDSIQADGIHT